MHTSVLNQQNSSETGLTTSSIQGHTPYWPELNGVRTIAFLMVFIFHKSKIPGKGILFDILNAFTSKFFFGVDLFFVLSGFLITYLLLNERKNTGNISLQAFYLRRTLRIWPMYFLAVSISAILYSFGYFLNDGGVDYLKHLSVTYAPFLLFVGNFSLILNKCQICDFTDPLGRMCTALLLPLWSLCVEEQFYLIWPIVVKWATAKALIRTALSLVIAALALRIALWSFAMKDHNYLIYYFNSACSVDALMLGGTLAILRIHFEDILKSFNRFLIPAALVSGSLIVATFYAFAQAEIDSLPMVFVMTFLPLLMTVFLHCIMQVKWLQKLFAAPPLANFGKYTYSAYLFHYVVICAVNQVFLKQFLHITTLSHYLYIFSISLFITFILARCAWQFIEIPCLKLRIKLQSPASLITDR